MITYFQKHSLVLWLLLLLVLFLLFWVNCSRPKEDVLAVVGHQTITVADFAQRYQQIAKRMSVPDNGRVRKQILSTLVDEALLIDEARRRGYQDDAAGKHEYERLTVQALLDVHLQSDVFDPLTIREDELKDLYVRLNTKIKARHLYAATRREADSLYAALMDGQTFETLARQVFRDPQLRDTGGELGYFSVDEMDPFFEEAAFALNLGQISKPVRTAQGYSIIQVQDRVVKPLLTESEYAKHRGKLEQYWFYRKKKEAARAYADSLKESLHIRMNQPTVEALLQAIERRVPFSEIQDALENGSFLSDTDPLYEKELVTSDLGAWNVKTFIQHARYTSEKQLNWVKSEESLGDFVSGLVVRACLLDKARASGFQKTDSFRKQVGEKMDDYLIQRINGDMAAAIDIPEDSLRVYYEQNTDRFIVPPGVHLSEIVVDNELKAREVEKKLAGGVSFDILAKAYSVHRTSAEDNGDIGSYTYGDLGKHADRIFGLKENQWTGPIQIDRQFAFIKCTGKEPQRVLSFDQARTQIIKGLKPIWLEQEKRNLLDSIRHTTGVVTYPEKLKTFQLN